MSEQHRTEKLPLSGRHEGSTSGYPCSRRPGVSRDEIRAEMAQGHECCALRWVCCVLACCALHAAAARTHDGTAAAAARHPAFAARGERARRRRPHAQVVVPAAPPSTNPMPVHSVGVQCAAGLILSRLTANSALFYALFYRCALSRRCTPAVHCIAAVRCCAAGGARSTPEPAACVLSHVRHNQRCAAVLRVAHFTVGDGRIRCHTCIRCRW